MGETDTALGNAHLPLRDIVRAQLQREILAGHLKPGDRLVEEELGRRYAVSRSPIREAIRTLASEGLVEVSARRGAIVAGITPAEAREFVEVRALLEGYNARLAARHRHPEILARAAAILKQAARPKSDLPALNIAFHDTMAEAAGNATLRTMLDTLRKRSARVFQVRDDKAQRAAVGEHRAILEAVLAGDEALAAERAEAHVRKAGAAYIPQAS